MAYDEYSYGAMSIYYSLFHLCLALMWLLPEFTPRKVKNTFVAAVVDRLEAVLLFGDEEIKVDFPLALLPQGVKKGSWLSISFELDLKGEQKQREKIEGLLEKLKNKNK